MNFRAPSMLCLLLVFLGLFLSVVFAAVVNLSDSDVILSGPATTGDETGHSVANAGDVNGDGISDFLVGAPLSDAPGGGDHGIAYLVYGSESLPGSLDLASPASDDEVVELRGPSGADQLGFQVAGVGDVNDDGYDDFAVSAHLAAYSGRGSSGIVYVVLGAPNLPRIINTANFAALGVTIGGASSSDELGRGVGPAGDFNDDGIDDLVVGAWRNDDGGGDAGAAYIIYGSTDLPVTIDLASLGSDGIVIEGAAGGDRLGRSCARVGDFNDDGIDDVVIGAERVDSNGSQAGSAYILFGESSPPAVSNLADINTVSGLDGVTVNGGDSNDHLGYSCAPAGDFNDDGIPDVIIGADDADDVESDVGAAVIIFGSATPPTVVDVGTMLSTTGVTIRGSLKDGRLGRSVAGLGDFDGDGVDDVAVGAASADDAAYVVLGETTPPAEILDTDLATDGFVYEAEAGGDDTGEGTAGSDVNGDGVGDLIVGSPDAGGPGKAYIVYGTSATTIPTGLTCTIADNDVALAWTNGATYDSVEVLRDGVIIATLTATATSYDDTTLTTGDYRYGVRGISGSLTGGQATCSVRLLETISGLACDLDAGATVQLSWANPADDDYATRVNDLLPLGYWRLGEASGTTATDEVGTSDGTYTAGVTLDQGGAIADNPAISVATSNYVEIPHVSDYLLADGTVCLWFYTTTTTGTRGLFSKDSSGFDTGGHLTISVVGARVEVRLQSTTDSYTLYTQDILPDRWNHVAFSFGSDGMQLYLNGVLHDSDIYTGGTGTTSGGSGNADPIALGVSTTSSGNLTVLPTANPFAGELDEVAIFGSQLAVADIRSLCDPVTRMTRILRDAVEVASLAPGTTTYEETPAAGDYEYCVRWEDGLGNSSDDDCCDVTVPVAPSALTCTVTSEGVDLEWTNGEDYDSIDVLRDGVVLATLAGTATAYTDAASAGSYDYSVIPVLNGNDATSLLCSVVVPEPVTAFVCDFDGISADLSWTNGEVYDSITVLRDGVFVISLAGTDTSHSDVVAPGSYDYQVFGITSGNESPTQLCTVDCPLVSIDTQPVSVTVCEAGSASFSTAGSGLGTITYQWRKDGVDLAGETADTLSVDPVTGADVASYSVLVSDDCSSVVSNDADLTVDLDPVITTEPGSASVCEGNPATLTVVATGAATLTYQWRKDGVDMAGETAATLSIASVVLADDADYDVVVANHCNSATSAVATLTILTAPAITTQPVAQTVCEDDLATYTVVATGTAPLTYQWRKDGVDLGGETADTLTIDPATGADDGIYTVVVSNSCSSVTSGDAALTVDLKPTITTQPASDTVCAGDAVTLTVVAAGAETLTYQWRKDGVDLTGETGSSLSLAAAIVADAADYDVVVDNHCGTVSSSVATLVVNVVPTITTQPTDQVVCENGMITFNVVADDGGDPVSYQWRKDGTDVSGATSDTLDIDATPVDAGVYDVVVTNMCGSVTSEPAMLDVDANPTVTVDPLSQTVCEGEEVTFSVTAAGARRLSYQWHKDGVDIAGATGSSLVLADVTTAAAADYDVTISNACDAITSAAATLTVDTAPVVTVQPLSQTICEGDPVTFTITATGTAPLTYQWRKAGVAISGETANSMTIASVTTADAEDYDVVVTNLCDTATSDAATLTVYVAPVISVDPASATLCDGATATFSVDTSAGEALSYQWRKGGVDVSGATAATLEIESLVASDAGDYDVVVSNICGSATSAVATLTINLFPVIRTNLTDEAVCEGDTLTLSVSATGTAPRTYQWRKDGVDLAGETASVLLLDTVAPGDAGDYDIVVSNICGSVTSATSAVTVDIAPAFDVQPQAVTVCELNTAVLSVEVSGSDLSYQWKKGSSDVNGATSATLTIDGVGFDDAGNYSVVVSNDCETITSDGAFLTVLAEFQFTEDPVSADLCVDEDYTLSVALEGPAFDLQWRKDGEDLVGETSATLDLEFLQPNDSGSYECVATSNCGSITSDAADVSVTVGPTITTQPADQVLCTGAVLELTVEATSDSLITYKWRKDGELIIGALSDTLVIDPTNLSDSGEYKVELTDDCGTVMSDIADIEILTAPFFLSQPEGIIATAEDIVTLEISVIGVDLEFQWRKDGVDIDGATDPTYTIDPVADEDSGVYDCVVTSSCGSVVSNEALVIVAVTEIELTLTCCNVDGTTSICWDTEEVADGYVIFKDGVLLAELDGTETCYDEAVTELGSSDYRLFADIGGSYSVPFDCTVPVIDEPTNLVCLGVQNGLTFDFTLTWKNNDEYDSVFVYRDDVLVVELGGDEESYDDLAVDTAENTYRVDGHKAGEGCDSVASGFDCESSAGDSEFVRGDANNDTSTNIADIVFMLAWLFRDGVEPGCRDAADTNDDGGNDAADAIYSISYQFAGGAAPPAPGPSECGQDPSGGSDGLDCESPPAGCL